MLEWSWCYSFSQGWILIGVNVFLVEPSAVHKMNRVVCLELYAQGVWLEDDSMVVIHWLRRKRSPLLLQPICLMVFGYKFLINKTFKLVMYSMRKILELIF